MKTNAYEQALSRSPLFRGCETSTLQAVLASPLLQVRSYCKRERILYGGKEPGALGILVKGKLKVGAKEDLRRLTVNQMEEGSVFGFASLYDQSASFLCDVYAAGAVTVIFMPEELVTWLIEKDPAAARNIIAMQAEKIRFLNMKIRSFASPDSASKLLCYLKGLPENETGCVTLPMGMAPLASRLGMSRVTLYRAFGELEKNGKIEKNGNTVRFCREE